MPRLSTSLNKLVYRIRLVNRGCVNRPFYLLVVQPRSADTFDKAAVIEQIGSYDPMPNKFGEKICGLNFERLLYWLGEPQTFVTRSAEQLIGLSGLLPVHPMTYIKAKRNRLKAAASKAPDAAATNEKTETAAST